MSVGGAPPDSARGSLQWASAPKGGKQLNGLSFWRQGGSDGLLARQADFWDCPDRGAGTDRGQEPRSTGTKADACPADHRADTLIMDGTPPAIQWRNRDAVQ
jgi:hypothetical protein